MTRTRTPGISRRSTLALMGAGAMSVAAPWVARAQAKTIKIGMRTSDECEPWTFGIGALMKNLAQRKLI